MKKQLSIIFLFFLSLSLFAEEIVIPSGKTTVDSYTDAQVKVSDGADLHITSQTPFVNSTVNLQTENSWLFFDNIRPNDVISNFLQYVKIGEGQATAVNGTNVRVEIYINGTVVIPHTNDIKPLDVFDAQNFAGNNQLYDMNYHKSLGEMDNKIRSFKLKRGYMATMATLSEGAGYSRVFIADDADIEMNMPYLLDETVSFIRVVKWLYPSKKGWCSSGSNWENEIDLTASTWYYSWSADKYTKPNQEYTVIKQHGGWPSGTELKNKTNVTHLLGFNEPDREDQANATVADAIANWPELLSTGLRLGSPAIADNFNWLYDFMAECESRNYRVDYVAIHSYWGGSGGAYNAYTNGQVDINKWYSKLKDVHTRTKRPLWITEWNNGANWTNETWPSGTAAQQQKQLEDLQKIIYMMDTCSFIERYSIYNWVEDKRAIVLGSPQYLTPAGEFYRDNKSKMAFNRAKEVIPSWTMHVPTISSYALAENNTKVELRLAASNYDELCKSYIVEEKIGEGEYRQIQNISNQPIVNRLSIPVDVSESGQYSYRIRIVDRAGNIGEPSKEVVFVFSANKDIQFDKVQINTSDWTTIYFGKSFDANPITILGTPTNNNMSVLMSNRIRNTSVARLQFRFYPWSYITSELYTNEELPYLFLPGGTYDFNGIKAFAGTTTANGDWSSVSFDVPEGYFTKTPIIIPTQTTSVASSATSIHLRNVTKDGFEICLRREEAKSYTIPKETIHFVVLSEGSGTIEGRKIRTGFIENVGQLTAQAVTLNWASSINDPLIFTHKQTSNNEYASNLRILSYTDTEARIVNQLERSSTLNPSTVPTDNAGWLIVEEYDGGYSGLLPIDGSQGHLKLYPNPVSDVLSFDNDRNEEIKIQVLNLQGVVLKKEFGKIHQIDMSDLGKGYYIVNINGMSAKVMKD